MCNLLCLFYWFGLAEKETNKQKQTNKPYANLMLSLSLGIHHENMQPEPALPLSTFQRYPKKDIKNLNLDCLIYVLFLLPPYRLYKKGTESFYIWQLKSGSRYHRSCQKKSAEQFSSIRPIHRLKIWCMCWGEGEEIREIREKKGGGE